MLSSIAMESLLRESEVLPGGRANSAVSAPVSGSIFSFVPAHGGSRAGAVAEQLSRTLTEGLGIAVLLADFDSQGYSPWRAHAAPHRLDGHTWGAFVFDSEDLDVLDAREVHPRELARLLDFARDNYAAVCADVTGAREAHALEVLRASDGIFLVGGTDDASIEGLREKTAWLKSIDLDDRCGLLVRRSDGGAEPEQVEDLTGLPVSGLIETDGHMITLARWLAANVIARPRRSYAEAV
jgi:hypothetical protein